MKKERTVPAHGGLGSEESKSLTQITMHRMIIIGGDHLILIASSHTDNTSMLLVFAIV